MANLCSQNMDCIYVEREGRSAGAKVRSCAAAHRHSAHSISMKSLNCEAFSYCVIFVPHRQGACCSGCCGACEGEDGGECKCKWAEQ